LQFFLHNVISKVYLEVNNGSKLEATIESIEAWKVFELEKVTIIKLFLENVLGSASEGSFSFKSMCCGLQASP
jgi:hypothetical protein